MRSAVPSLPPRIFCLPRAAGAGAHSPKVALCFERVKFPKSTKREPQTKSFVKGHKKIAEQERLLGYYYISQKFLSVDFGFGLCENSHNAKAKNKEYKNIVKFFKLTDQMLKKCLC